MIRMPLEYREAQIAAMRLAYMLSVGKFRYRSAHALEGTQPRRRKRTTDRGEAKRKARAWGDARVMASYDYPLEEAKRHRHSPVTGKSGYGRPL